MFNDVVPAPGYRTRHIHASLYARDNLPIPFDRRDLRMLERARGMNYMWDDLVSVRTTTPTTPAYSVQQRERCPGRVCRRASRDTYDAEVCHGGEILYRERRTDFSPADISKVQQYALLQRVKNIFTGYRIR